LQKSFILSQESARTAVIQNELFWFVQFHLVKRVQTQNYTESTVTISSFTPVYLIKHV